jgi:hypothetical protein
LKSQGWVLCPEGARIVHLGRKFIFSRGCHP